MDNIDFLVFIDANQYLNLYRVTKGKKLLAPLLEQQNYIFVTEQVVAEVQRSKLHVAADFLNKQFEQLKVRGFDVPDHLFDISKQTDVNLRKKLGSIDNALGEVNKDLTNATIETLQRISRSEDEVSKALGQLFTKAVPHTEEEIRHARDRKERGNPPGKKADPLGDQLMWEQLLSQFKGKSKLWIITRDSDFCTKLSNTMFLNPHLYQDLVRLNGQAPEIYCFDSIDNGIRDFVSKEGIKAEKLPTSEESKEIKEEQDSLPPLGWLPSEMTDPSIRLWQNFAREYYAQPFNVQEYNQLSKELGKYYRQHMKPDPDKTSES